MSSEPSTPSGSRRQSVALSHAIDAFLRSPFAGLAPWVVISLVSGPGRFEAATTAALGLALLVVWIGRRRGIAVHALDVYGVAFFGGLAVVGGLAGPAAIAWLEIWAGEIANIGLAVFAAASMLARRPFTAAYARDSTPPEVWETALFRRINMVVTAVWTAVFAVGAAAGAFGDVVLRNPDDFWCGWIVPLAAVFFGIAFTEAYPDRASAAAPRAGREFIRLFDWAPTFVLITGIAGLVTDSLSGPVGYTLIGVGAAASVLWRRVFAAR